MFDTAVRVAQEEVKHRSFSSLFHHLFPSLAFNFNAKDSTVISSLDFVFTQDHALETSIIIIIRIFTPEGFEPSI